MLFPLTNALVRVLSKSAKKWSFYAPSLFILSLILLNFSLSAIIIFSICGGGGIRPSDKFLLKFSSGLARRRRVSAVRTPSIKMDFCIQKNTSNPYAVGVGFEPTRPLRAAVFETAPLSRFGTPPYNG